MSERTHCRNGHRLTASTIFMMRHQPGGKFYPGCRICRSEADRLRYRNKQTKEFMGYEPRTDLPMPGEQKAP